MSRWLFMPHYSALPRRGVSLSPVTRLDFDASFRAPCRAALRERVKMRTQFGGFPGACLVQSVHRCAMLFIDLISGATTRVCPSQTYSLFSSEKKFRAVCRVADFVTSARVIFPVGNSSKVTASSKT
jgi:hypothetical protein